MRTIGRAGVLLVVATQLARAVPDPDLIPDAARAPVAAEVSPPTEIVMARDGEARGFEREPRGRALRGRFLLKAVGRGLAFLSRVLIVYPVRGAAYLQARWRVYTRIRDVFENDAGTLAIYPIASYSTSFGLTLGATTFYKDWGGNDERVTFSASALGDVVQAYQTTLDLPRILGSRFYARSRLRYEENLNVPFAGIGNGTATMGTGLDARTAQIPTQFAHERYLATASAGIDLGRAGRRVRVGATAIYNDRTFGSAPAELVSIEEVYDTSTITGFDTGFQNLELTGDLEIDTRDSAGPAPHGGVIRSFAGMGSLSEAYTHYGIELAYHFSPFWRDRVFVGRVALEGAYAEDGVIPFTELPRLGGVGQLRGFGTDQFRDRLSAVATLEYRYPIHANLAGHLFAEVGKVARTYDELATLGLANWHLGYGGGLIVQMASAIKFRVDLAYGDSFQFYFSTDVLDAFRRREREL